MAASKGVLSASKWFSRIAGAREDAWAAQTSGEGALARFILPEGDLVEEDGGAGSAPDDDTAAAAVDAAGGADAGGSSVDQVADVFSGPYMQIRNVKTGELFACGSFSVVPLAQLRAAAIAASPALAAHLSASSKSSSSVSSSSSSSTGSSAAGASSSSTAAATYVPFEVVTRTDGASIKCVDVAHVQASAANCRAVFQVASNFNGVEAISDTSTPDDPGFTENYIYDRTQGPAASISAGPGAISRVYGAFARAGLPQEEWKQTAQEQVNFLGSPELAPHYPVRNGYVCLRGTEPDDFPRPGTAEYRALLDTGCAGVHRDIQVTTGHNRGAQLEVLPGDAAQVVDNVLCAAVNCGQGMTGARNASAPNSAAKVRLALDLAYESAYLAAIASKREVLYLTRIGGGVFANDDAAIDAAIVAAHTRYAVAGCGLKKVAIIAFSQSDEPRRAVPSLLRAGVPVSYEVYTDGVATTKVPTVKRE